MAEQWWSLTQKKRADKLVLFSWSGSPSWPGLVVPPNAELRSSGSLAVSCTSIRQDYSSLRRAIASLPATKIQYCTTSPAEMVQATQPVPEIPALRKSKIDPCHSGGGLHLGAVRYRRGRSAMSLHLCKRLTFHLRTSHVEAFCLASQAFDLDPDNALVHRKSILACCCRPGAGRTPAQKAHFSI